MADILSKRDSFAIQILVAFLGNSDFSANVLCEDLTELAVEQADLLIEQLDKTDRPSLTDLNDEYWRDRELDLE